MVTPAVLLCDVDLVVCLTLEFGHDALALVIVIVIVIVIVTHI